MYRELMSIHGASQKDGEYIHASRLKEFNLENVSTLCESKTRKYIVLTLGDDMGQYLFLEVRKSSSHGNEIIIAKAANIKREHMFPKEVSFERDLSQTIQTPSGPTQFLHLHTLL